MGVIKVTKATGFALIPNLTAQDARLSPRALGVLTYLVSLPEQWEIRDNHLKSRWKIGREALRKIWGELESAGYCRRDHKVRQEGGRFCTVTSIYAESQFPTVGGLAAGGSPADRVPTTLERKSQERKTEKENNLKLDPPQAEKTSPPSAGLSLTFSEKFGVDFDFPSVGKFDENRAVKIALKHKLDEEGFRRVAAEYLAGFGREINNPAAYFNSLCTRQQSGNLKLSKMGEDFMPRWS